MIMLTDTLRQGKSRLYVDEPLATCVMVQYSGEKCFIDV